ncbi:Mu-like prophage major head subunit gpT family protein [Pseudomonas aeruginosa]|uniref:Mu-like prophage major head subunit gpT family protein n=1 Tax=Pseudomonas aeruginosa TaxID=287 RepID=UPI00071B733A|nr:Mu-like prophage major head subunit gpT family protein [Pseudomonas aeruginosa]KSR84414.1 head protein [Pseudomonas aeruginosa]RMJ84799.1 head protein [Pseudomonas aeruginosa]HCF4991298.1 Mu-like prophage major head subunit gpT family protein [Pseudomonas aeruginosa]
MAIITPALISALKTSFQKHFQDALATAPSTYLQVATVIPSTTASNTYGWLGQFPKLREWIGQRVIKDMAAQGYQITNKLFESTVGVKRTDIEDDNLGVYGPLMQEMGRAAGAHPDELVFALLKAGNANLCYDGQNFFDTDHPVYPNVDGTGTATTVSNLFAPAADPGAAWYLLDTSRSLKPLIYQERMKPSFTSMTKEDDEQVFMADEYRYGVRSRCNVGFGFWQLAAMSTEELNRVNFEKVYDAMRNQKADGGRPLDIRPNLLVVPTTLRSKAKEVVGVQRLANGADNPNFELVQVLDTAWLN